jgi:hypothetical protein
MESIDRVGVTESLPPSCTANAGSSAKRSDCPEPWLPSMVREA